MSVWRFGRGKGWGGWGSTGPRVPVVGGRAGGGARDAGRMEMRGKSEDEIE